jgi:hypothetical protein
LLTSKAAVSPVIGKVTGPAREIHTGIVAGQKPFMTFPLRHLAKHDLNHVIDTYPPAKLEHPERFLP